MDQRKAMIAEAREVLAVLGAEDAVVPMSQVTINKGKIVEVTKEVVIDNTDEIITLENEIAFKDGQIIGFKRQIKELEDKVAELQSVLDAKKLTKVKPIQEELKEYKQELNKESDAMAQPKKTNSKLNGLKSMKNNFSLKAANEELKDKEEIKLEANEIKINWKQDVFDEKVNSFSCMMMGVHGDITINDKSYKFTARREYSLPIVYSFDEEVVRIAKEEINKIDRFKLATERTTNDINSKYANDKEYPIKVWRLTEDNGHVTYHGFTKDKANKLVALTWAPDKMDKKNCVGRALVSNLFTDKENWKSLRDNKVLADKFMAVCSDIWPEDFTKELEDTNEIVVDFTNDPTAGCDDLDI